MTGVVRQTPLVCPGHKRGVVDLQYSIPTDEGVFLMSGCLDGNPMLRDGVSGDWIGTFQGHSGAVWSACISDDTFLAATGSADQSASVWDARTGDRLATFEQKHICKSVALPEDASKLITGGVFKTVNLYDVSRPDTVLVEFPVGPVRFARFLSGNKDTILVGAYNGKLSQWDARSMELIREVDTGVPMRSGEVPRTREVMSLVMENDTVEFRDTRSLELVCKYKIPEGSESCTLQPSQEKFVVCGKDLTVRVFSYGTGAELECHRGHHGPVYVARFAPDGETYSTGADDGTIRIWQTNPKPNNVPPTES